ncbi:MAG: hypothetical protein V3T22_10370 [Planctomycetota bacterium]
MNTKNELMKTNEQTDALGTVAKRTSETAGMVLAEKAKAMVQARIVQALNRPRNTMTCRTRILQACQRPRFAEAARYQVKNRGSGPSIRFAEEFARDWDNLFTETVIVYDDEEKRIVHTESTDLETNTSFGFDVVIEKTVERNSAGGREVLATRKNTYGKDVYILRATEEEVLTKANSAVSKAMRTNILRHCPSDIQEEAMEVCITTVRDRDAKDPDAAKKALIDAFVRLNVMPDDLAAYLGGPIAQASPAQLTELRGVWTLLNEGQTTWAEVVEEKPAEGEDAPQSTKDRIKAKSAGKKKAAPKEQPAEEADANMAAAREARKDAEKAASEEAPAEKTEEPSVELIGRLSRAFGFGMQASDAADVPTEYDKFLAHAWTLGQAGETFDSAAYAYEVEQELAAQA